MFLYNVPFICTANIKNVRMDWILESTALKENCLHKDLSYEKCIKLINTPLNDAKNKLLPFIDYSKQWLTDVLDESNTSKVKLNNKVAVCLIAKNEEQYLVE